MDISTRSYFPVHSVSVVIEMRALQPTVQHTRHCDRISCFNVRCFCVMIQVDLTMKPEMLELESSSQM